MNLIKFFVKNYVFSLSIFTAIVLFGLVGAAIVTLTFLPALTVFVLKSIEKI